MDAAVVTPPQKISVLSTDPEMQRMAKGLSRKLSLPLAKSLEDNSELFLLVEQQGLSLQLRGPNAPGAITVDFVGGNLGHRRKFGISRQQIFARAIGIKNRPLKVIDATAGLGRDTFFLACLGCDVRAVEKNPVLMALLEDGYQRGLNTPDVGKILAEKVRLIQADAIEYFKTLKKSERPDVIYLDPMFPEKKKSALSPKEMQTLQALLGAEENPLALLEAALVCATSRVVVKRPLKSKPVKPGANHSFAGKSVRYDLYLIKPEKPVSTTTKKVAEKKSISSTRVD